MTFNNTEERKTRAAFIRNDDVNDDSRNPEIMACALRSFSLFLYIAQRERERETAFDDILIFANSNGKERDLKEEDKTKHIIQNST